MKRNVSESYNFKAEDIKSVRLQRSLARMTFFSEKFYDHVLSLWSVSSQDHSKVSLTSPVIITRLQASQPTINTHTLPAQFVTICVRVEISSELHAP